MQGNPVRIPPPASSSSGGGASFDLPSSPAGFEGFTRARARRSSIVSVSSITSEPSFEKDVDFGIAASITLQVERMLQVGLLTSLCGSPHPTPPSLFPHQPCHHRPSPPCCDMVHLLPQTPPPPRPPLPLPPSQPLPLSIVTLCLLCWVSSK